MLGHGRSTKTPPITVIALWNVVPLAGVVVFGWDPLLIFVLYWLEFFLIILSNTPKIMLAEGERVGRFPDDIALWPDGPSIRLTNAWLGLCSLVLYSTFFAVLSRVSPLWDVLVEATLFGSGGLSRVTVFLAVLALAVSHLLSFRDEFLGKREYEQVTPTTQFYRPFGDLWLFVLIVLFASGLEVFEGNLTAIVIALILVKGATDLIARGWLRVHTPNVAPYARRAVPEEPPEWTGRPAIRPILCVWAVPLSVLAAVVMVYGTISGLVVLELADWGTVGYWIVGGVIVCGGVSVVGVGLATVYLRYRFLEYRVYSVGIAFYNTRHDTLARFVRFSAIDNCRLSRGLLPRLFGVGSVNLSLEDAPGAGRFRTVFSDDGKGRGKEQDQHSTGSGTDQTVLSLRALPDPTEPYELIDRQQ